MKILATREGREGLYLVSKPDITAWLSQYKEQTIHNFIATRVMIGSDWDKKAVIEKINESDDSLVCVTTGMAKAQNMVHALALASDKLYLFDIGDITDDDIEIKD